MYNQIIKVFQILIFYIFFTMKFNDKSNGKSFIQLDMELQDVPQASVHKFHNRCLNGRFWCIKDICGLVCAVFTWGLILYAE